MRGLIRMILMMNFKKGLLEIFDINEDRIKVLYKRAWYDCDRGYVDPNKPYTTE